MKHWFTGGDGIRLAADFYGPDSGAPVLLIGGLGQTRHSWRRVALRLAEQGYRAITLDFRGHGESDRAPDGDYSYPRQSADLAAVARAVGRPLVLVGNSLGGKLCFATAGNYGEEVCSALVMVDTVPRNNREAVAEVAQSMTVSPEGFDSPDSAARHLAESRGAPFSPGDGERLRRNMRQDDSGRWHWHWDGSYRDPSHGLGRDVGAAYLEAAARNVKVPALLAWCELSEVVTADGVAALKAVLPQLEVEIIAGARHMIVGDENDVFADSLIGFLTRHGL
ncbi:MAG TPA: alpha/beta hydrolase [Novosphingobium sp.]|nr:alpha/beta hydrolase [Novosphingobium sp.]